MLLSLCYHSSLALVFVSPLFALAFVALVFQTQQSSRHVWIERLKGMLDPDTSAAVSHTWKHKKHPVKQIICATCASDM